MYIQFLRALLCVHLSSYTEEKFHHDSDPAVTYPFTYNTCNVCIIQDIDLIVKFLRKAACNLRGNFQVIEPNFCIPVRDRCV